MVPVLPAAGRSPSDILEPVRPEIGPSTTPMSISVTVSATGRSITWVQSSPGTGSRFCSRSRTSRMLRGLQYSPCAANVA